MALEIRRRPLRSNALGKLTGSSLKSVMLAVEEARKGGAEFVGTEHLLLGLSGVRDTVAAKVLLAAGAGFKNIRTAINDIQGKQKPSGLRGLPVVSYRMSIFARHKLSAQTQAILKRAVQETALRGGEIVKTEHPIGFDFRE